MSQARADRVFELLVEARQSGFTLEAVAKAEEAVRLADESEDRNLGYETRCELMDIAVFSGFYEKATVAFSWCLAKADQYPDEFSTWQLLWKYKWVIENLVHFPRVSRALILATLDDFRSRSLKAGFNERPALYLRWCVEMLMGNIEAATEWYERWKCVERDGMADCEACERNRVAELFAMRDQHARAIEEARPILKGRMRCGEIPHLTYATLLKSFWMTDQKVAGEAYHQKGYRLVRNNRDFIREQSWHVFHLLRSEQLESAAALVRKHLPWALETKSLDYRFYFLVATRAFLRQTTQAGVNTLRLRLPNTLCPVAAKTTVKVAELSGWTDSLIIDLAAQFDARNGNQWFSRIAQSL